MDKQIDIYFEVVSIKNSLSKQTFHLKKLILLLFFFTVFEIIGQMFFQSSHYE